MSKLLYLLPFLLLLLLLNLPLVAEGEGFTIIDSDTIRDQGGRQIDVQEPFSRIISLYGAHTENLYALGAGGQVVGVSRSMTYPPRARENPGFSYHQGVERFLAVDPDLILVRPMIDEGYPQLISRLEQAGIKVVSLQPRTPEEITTYWRILGLLSGRQDRAERLIDEFERKMDQMRELGPSAEERKTVYFESIHDQMKTFAPKSIAMHVLETAGGRNAASDARSVRDTNIAEFSRERILDRGEEIDVYLTQKGPMNQPTKEMIRNSPGFSQVKAVREDRVHIIEEYIVSRPTPRLLLGTYRIGRILYPDSFTSEKEDSIQELIHGLYNKE